MLRVAALVTHHFLCDSCFSLLTCLVLSSLSPLKQMNAFYIAALGFVSTLAHAEEAPFLLPLGRCPGRPRGPAPRTGRDWSPAERGRCARGRPRGRPHGKNVGSKFRFPLYDTLSASAQHFSLFTFDCSQKLNQSSCLSFVVLNSTNSSSHSCYRVHSSTRRSTLSTLWASRLASKTTAELAPALKTSLSTCRERGCAPQLVPPVYLWVGYAAQVHAASAVIHI